MQPKRKLESFVLSAKQRMNAIAQRRALADEKTALAEHLPRVLLGCVPPEDLRMLRC
jgi:hypothetical protein